MPKPISNMTPFGWRVVKAVSAAIGYPPMHFLKPYLRGQGVMWQVRDCGEDKHAAIAIRINRELEKEELLRGNRVEVRVNKSRKSNKDTTVFIFIHSHERQLINALERFGKKENPGDEG